MTHACPVYEGFALQYAIRKNFIAGQAITKEMESLLCAEGIEARGSKAEWINTVKAMKEKLCYVQLKNGQDIKETTYDMPDGNTIAVESTRYKAPEILFNPEGGIHKMCVEAIAECDADIKQALYMNIVLSGGSTLFPGLSERLNEELQRITPSKLDIIAD